MASVKRLSCLKFILVIVSLIILAGITFLYSGIYPMGADVPHNKLTYWTLETLRENSIKRASKDITVPSDLDTSSRLLRGGADYNDMCVSCHLQPGKNYSDFTKGLYPAPPNLAKAHNKEHIDNENTQAQRRFWIIKHGIKASGMPAWGPGHDDERIWGMVAFLKHLPTLTPEQYQILTPRGDGEGAHH